MSSADTNRTRLSSVRETTPGTTPATPAWRPLRVTGDTLKSTIRTSAPTEIRDDRQTASISTVAVEVGGGFTFQFSPRTFDDQIEEAMFDLWDKTPEIENTAADTEITDVDSVTDTFTVAAGGAAFKAGHLTRSTGFGVAANNQLFRVTSSTATTVVGGTLEDEMVPPVGAKLKVVGLRGAAAGSITAVTAGGNKLTVATTDPGPSGLGLQVGQWFRAAGFTGITANNGWYRVSSISGSGPWDVFLDRVPTGFAADAAATEVIDLFFCDFVRNGTTKLFSSFERFYADVGIYALFKGCLLDMALSIQAEAEISGSFTVMGMDGPAPSDTRFAGSTDKAASTTDVITSSASIGALFENGVQVAQASNFVYGLELSVANNPRRKPVIGSTVSAQLGVGKSGITGTLSAYFVDETRLAALRAGTAQSFSTIVIDQNTGDGYVIDIPHLKYTDGDAPVPGENQDVTTPFPFTALRHPTLGYQLHIQKIIE